MVNEGWLDAVAKVWKLDEPAAETMRLLESEFDAIWQANTKLGGAVLKAALHELESQTSIRRSTAKLTHSHDDVYLLGGVGYRGVKMKCTYECEAIALTVNGAMQVIHEAWCPLANSDNDNLDG